MTKLKTLYALGFLAILTTPSSVFAKENASASWTESYVDVGSGLGMEWNFHTVDGQPILEFGVKETSHRLDRLWEFTCANLDAGQGTISNTIFAKSPEVRKGDEFGFSIRVDDGRSFGLVGHKGLFQIQGVSSHYPQFDISDSHNLWDEMRRGKRAFVNMNGNKFSIHLNGSSHAIQNFLNACSEGVG
ncbi:MAG: hypothetical protein AB8B54_01935 [Sphingorhabdus sp.]